MKTKTKVIIFSAVLMLMWWIGNKNKHTSGGSYSSGSSSSGVTHTCINCGKTYSGYGFATANGEEYELTSDGGNQFCSRSCAKASRPSKWRN
jgi:hypothetical protein